jgi:hypothetical protein
MDNFDETINKLILDGVLEIAGINIDTGEPLYNFTPKLKDYNQELYDIHNNYFFQELTNLWEKGFINMSFFDNDPSVTLTKKASDIDEIQKLSRDEKHSLNEIKRVYKENDES